MVLKLNFFRKFLQKRCGACISVDGNDSLASLFVFCPSTTLQVNVRPVSYTHLTLPTKLEV